MNSGLTEELDLVDCKLKNKALTRLYWYSVTLITIAEFGVAMFYKYGIFLNMFGSNNTNYYIYYLILPVIINLLIGVICTYILKKYNDTKPFMTCYGLMIFYVLLAHNIIVIHYGTAIIYTIYILPIFISIIYSNKNLTKSVAVMSVMSYLYIILFYLPSKELVDYRHNTLDKICAITIIIIAFLVSNMLLSAYESLNNKIAEIQIANQRLEYELKLDPLTNLYNHSTFYRHLDEAIFSFKETGKRFSIIVLDIDNFKKINDLYGHSFGDKVILKLADCIKAPLQEHDTAHRYGGEEFAVLCQGNEQDTVNIANSIRIIFSEQLYPEHPEMTCTVSAGVCEYKGDIIGHKEFFSKADKALYIAKNNGKNRVEVG